MRTTPHLRAQPAPAPNSPEAVARAAFDSVAARWRAHWRGHGMAPSVSIPPGCDVEAVLLAYDVLVCEERLLFEGDAVRLRLDRTRRQ